MFKVCVFGFYFSLQLTAKLKIKEEKEKRTFFKVKNVAKKIIEKKKLLTKIIY